MSCLNMEDFECPVDDCEECEYHFTTSWCSQAIQNHEEIDDVYKARVDGWMRGIEAAEREFKTTIEALDAWGEAVENGTFVEVVRCKNCKWLRYCETEDLDPYLDCDCPDGGGIPRNEEWYCADGETE